MADHFVPGEEIVAYHSAEELRSLINYYLDHPEEAGAIASRARKRTLLEHTYEVRMRQMLEVLGSPDSAASQGLPESEARFRSRLAQIRDTIGQGGKLNRQDRIMLLAEAVRTSKSWSEIGYGRPRPKT